MTDKKKDMLKSKNGNLLRSIRVAMGLTVTKLANMADVEYFTVYRAETGSVIRPDRAYKLAKALNISPDIVFYCIGMLPEETSTLIQKDPLGFKEMIDEFSETPWRLKKTQEYMDSLKKEKESIKEGIESIKEKLDISNPAINKLLSRIKPAE